MNDKESFNAPDNTPAENNPWENIADEAKTPLPDREGNIQLDVVETPTPEPYNPSSTPDADGPLPAPEPTPTTPEPNPDIKSEPTPEPETYGGANGENTGGQENRVES